MRTLMILLLTACALFSQRIFYSPDRDKLGQEAAAIAGKLASDPITKRHLRNLSIIESQQIDSVIKDGHLTMRAKLNSLSTWQDVSRVLSGALDVLPGTVRTAALSARGTARTFSRANAVKSLMSAREGLQSSLEIAPQKASDKKSVTMRDQPDKKETATWADPALARIADAEQLLSLYESLSGSKAAGAPEALDEIEKGIRELQAMSATVAGIASSDAGVSPDPRSLMPSREKLLLQYADAEAIRIKELTAIRVANALYIADLRLRVSDSIATLKSLGIWNAPEHIEVTLNANAAAGDRNRQRYALEALHVTAAAAAFNQTPASIRLLRESLANRRHSARRDAIFNGAYEAALKAAAERLRDYHAAGFKKDQIASLLYHLSGIVSLPKLAF